jgi:hypothetical protein
VVKKIYRRDAEALRKELHEVRRGEHEEVTKFYEVIFCENLPTGRQVCD